jgi:hypothetical protein
MPSQLDTFPLISTGDVATKEGATGSMLKVEEAREPCMSAPLSSMSKVNEGREACTPVVMWVTEVDEVFVNNGCLTGGSESSGSD